jgi:hypothetical protein
MRLKGTGRVFHLHLLSYYFALELGAKYGWRPRTMISAQAFEKVTGSSFDDLYGWYGSFFNEGHRVSAVEAENWADALESALADIPDHDAMAHKPAASPMPEIIRYLYRDMHQLPDASQLVGAFEWFSGARKQELRDLIDFCREGHFSIW